LDLDQEERDVLEYASAQMARALLRAREAQSEVQSQLLEAMHIEPEGKVRALACVASERRCYVSRSHDPRQSCQ
jgi:hypothetical protein